MNAKQLPARPNLEYYRKEAKHLAKACKAGEAAALERLRNHHPHAARFLAPDAPVTLADAQCVIARENGFESWPKFTKHFSRISEGDIVAAAQRGDVEAARAMLCADPSLINSKDGEGHGLLYVTAMHGFNERVQSNRAFVDFLIAEGAKLDLHAAACLARPDRVREILRNNPAAVNQPAPPYNCTALHYAAERGHLETVKALVELGADMNVRDKFGRTPLAVAAHAGPWKPEPAAEVIDYLLEQGAPLDLFGAAALGNVELLDRLAAHGQAALDARDPGGCTALWHAARNNRMDAVRWIVDHGAPVNAMNADGQTALSTAVLHLLPQQTDPALIRYLMEKGATPNVCAAAALGDVDLLRRLFRERPDAVNEPLSGFSPAYYALHCWKPECLRELARAGASLAGLEADIRNICGPRDPALLAELLETNDPMKLLKKVFIDHDATIFRQLLERFPACKARINEPVLSFDSPMMVHVHTREMLDVLLDAGADINARSRWWAGGFGLLDHANPDLAAYAIQHGAIVDIHAAVRLGMIGKVRELISTDPALVHARGGDGQTPLHFAGTVEMAKFLLDHGADIDARDVDHESTPAQYMVDDRPEIARYLIQRGCKTDIFMAAALGDAELVRKHLDADPNCIHMRVDNEYFPMINKTTGGTIYQWKLGWHVSPHDVAKKFGHDEVFRLLAERSPTEVKLLEACWAADENAAQFLLANNAGLVARLSPSDRQQVAHAARNNNPGAVRAMLIAGLPVDVQGQHGGTPLHWAAFHGNAEMTREILRYHPPLEATDTEFHSTPLGWAIQGSEHGWHAGDFAAAVELLLHAGATFAGTLRGSEDVRAVLKRHGVKE